jgi:hypothetical protein
VNTSEISASGSVRRGFCVGRDGDRILTHFQKYALKVKARRCGKAYCANEWRWARSVEVMTSLIVDYCSESDRISCSIDCIGFSDRIEPLQDEGISSPVLKYFYILGCSRQSVPVD